MSQSAIWDALLVAGDALQDGRLDDCEGVLAEIDAMGAWDFELLDDPFTQRTLRAGDTLAVTFLVVLNTDIATVIDRINRKIATTFGIPAEYLGGPTKNSSKRRLEAHFGLPHR